MVVPPDIDGLPSAELKQLVLKLLEENAEQTRVMAELREEIARLKGLKGRPPIKPSGMENGTSPKPGGKRGRRRGRGKATPRVSVEEQILKAEVPAGSRFKGYEDFVAQEIVLRARVIRYRRERWVTPDGRTVIAPLPAGVTGHVGPELRRFVLAQYHQGQVTVPRLLAQLQAIGVSISKRQLVRLLIGGQDAFLAEARDVLRTGLETASWITVDDTGARHKGRNGVCTQIGNDKFAWFGTTGSKSRLNFLDLLRAGHTDYTINDAALAYMRERALSGSVTARLAEHPDKQFADPEAWQAHLDRLGIMALTVTPDPVQISTEGALWGSIHAHDFLRDGVVVSDDAGQFAIGRHALCWVHAERLVHRLDTFTGHQRVAQQRVRSLIWRFYADLKAYRTNPTPRRRGQLRVRFDRIFCRRTDFVTLDRLLVRLHANKAELLAVLDHPDIPLHTNGSENDIRCQVTKRKVSGGTRSDVGRDCRECLPRPGQDLRQVGCRLLGLSREQDWYRRPAGCAAPARTYPLSRSAGVGAAAQDFAPLTEVRNG
ncbi:MAG TPA: transposase, partial [Steroidobacteraceae bacterium]|nr:transposase [Steroidobacteraceae bacterium]